MDILKTHLGLEISNENSIKILAKFIPILIRKKKKCYQNRFLICNYVWAESCNILIEFKITGFTNDNLPNYHLGFEVRNIKEEYFCDKKKSKGLKIVNISPINKGDNFLSYKVQIGNEIIIEKICYVSTK